MDGTPAAYIGALDQGTTSTRFMIFDHRGRVVSVGQKDHEQIYPQPGWVEHDPLEIWRRTVEVIDEAAKARGLRAKDLSAIGITNQRETTVVWNKATGIPVYNALVWQDTRVADAVAKLTREAAGQGPNAGQDRFRARTGLPLSTYFSGLKIAWILDAVKGARAQAERGDLLFGNIDTYLLWNMTGGIDGGVHLTDVTNASRTQLMNLATPPSSGTTTSSPPSASPAPCFPRSAPAASPTATSNAPSSPASPSAASSATSTPPSSARPASTPARSKTPTAPAASSS
jgi:glycerol kinase